VVAIAGGLAAASGLYTWYRLRQFAPARPDDAKDAAHIMLQGGQKVLAFTAHPDDLELFAGGALRRLYQLGNPITVVVGSDGERSRPVRNLGSKRRDEQRKAGSILGYDEVKFLSIPDRTLKDKDELHKQIRDIYDQERPHLVLTFDHVHIHPWIYHEDHVAMGEAVVHTANETDSDAAVYLYGSAKPTVVIDIGPVIKQKIRAVSSHQSQFPVFRRQGSEALVRRLGTITARGTGFRYAEAFRSLHNIHTFVPPRAKMPPQKTETMNQANPPH
jgi:LmbE family N-acetylglucosaminyl deacetylase